MMAKKVIFLKDMYVNGGRSFMSTLASSTCSSSSVVEKQKSKPTESTRLDQQIVTQYLPNIRLIHMTFSLKHFMSQILPQPVKCVLLGDKTERVFPESILFISYTCYSNRRKDKVSWLMLQEQGGEESLQNYVKNIHKEYEAGENLVKMLEEYEFPCKASSSLLPSFTSRRKALNKDSW